MTIQEAILQRHSVRAYKPIPLEKDVIQQLEQMIEEINEISGLHIQLVKNEPKAFRSLLAHYGRFSGVTNYIAIIGKSSPALDESCGYYGEQLVLQAQMMGLNTCWVKLTYKKIPDAYQIRPGEELVIVIAIGYGMNEGKPHRSKPMEALCGAASEMPDWFRSGMDAVLLAPTAVNQQKFQFHLDGNTVTATAPKGPCTDIDLGIAKYHFEVGAGSENFRWA